MDRASQAQALLNLSQLRFESFPQVHQLLPLMPTASGRRGDFAMLPGPFPFNAALLHNFAAPLLQQQLLQQQISAQQTSLNNNNVKQEEEEEEDDEDDNVSVCRKSDGSDDDADRDDDPNGNSGSTAAGRPHNGSSASEFLCNVTW
ncbi:hypothetical protein ANCCAN_00150 [Ancylostoma caninum]|uniref:Uncharacterized protein n=1 Tax=Ancylostoma caninum TaxID=29170 RepID=A0A368HAT7_ANCCA|nr:hypothetical protein ANCCAN_00150 [Ancylostoma caninum]